MLVGSGNDKNSYNGGKTCVGNCVSDKIFVYLNVCT